MIILVPTLFLLLVLFKELGPLFFIGLAGLFTASKIWENFDHSNEGWQHNKVDETYLTLGYIGNDSVVQWVNLELMDLL